MAHHRIRGVAPIVKHMKKVQAIYIIILAIFFLVLENLFGQSLLGYLCGTIALICFIIGIGGLVRSWRTKRP